MTSDDEKVSGPHEVQVMEFTGHSWAEAFHAAGDWFAANDGEIEAVRALSPHVFPGGHPAQRETWYILAVYHDG